MKKYLGSAPTLVAFVHAVAGAGLLVRFGTTDTGAETSLFTPAVFLQLLVVWHTAATWWTTCRRNETSSPPDQRWRGGSVDVFVTVCGEPLHIVLPVIRAARDMSLPHHTWVLDDGASRHLRAACLAEGVGYLSRSTRQHGKAGNVNRALARTQGELVAIFDADHKPDADFLSRTVMYFGDERIAFVQTPQSYVEHGTLAARGARDSQAFFYRDIMPAKARAGAAPCVGTNVVFRRAALEQVGGLYEGSMSEDVHTSLRLHALGWRSVFVGETLAHGLPPTSWPAYLRQQRRWARGALEILLSASLWRRGLLDGRQRLQYSLLATHYLASISALLMSVFPAVYLLVRESPTSAHPGILLGLVASATVTTALAHRARGGGYGVAGALAHVVAAPAHLLGLLDVVTRRRGAWTPTHGARSSRWSRAREEWLHLAMAALHVTAVALGLVIIAARLGYARPAAFLELAAAGDLWALLPLGWCAAAATVLLLPLIDRLRAALQALAKPLRWSAATFCCAVLVIASVGVGQWITPQEHQPPLESAVPMTWREDFRGPAGARPSGRDWIFASGHHYPGGPPNWGTGEIQKYVHSPRNLRLDGKGNLEIIATVDDSGQYRSARIETRRSDFRPPPGGTLRIQARVALPAARGAWATFWALGRSFRNDLRWPQAGEIDVIEYRGTRPDEVYGVLHCVSCGEPIGKRSRYTAPSGLANGFHTYTVDWRHDPPRMEWYVDGELYQSITPDALDGGSWDFRQPVFLLLNLAVGGHWPGMPEEDDFPATMKVDYIEARTCVGDCPPQGRAR
uniref:glycosyltransferase family 2 protein n=1 Tax=Nonomuraea bangladeshensis TaxID=404385 RepID=UPI003F497EB7